LERKRITARVEDIFWENEANARTSRRSPKNRQVTPTFFGEEGISQHGGGWP
jgi:hypothetical protein